MVKLQIKSICSGRKISLRPRRDRLWISGFCTLGLAAALIVAGAAAQDEQLNKVHVQPPASSTPPAAGAPAGAEKPAETGPGALKIHPGSLIRMKVYLGLVPVAVTH